MSTISELNADIELGSLSELHCCFHRGRVSNNKRMKSTRVKVFNTLSRFNTLCLQYYAKRNGHDAASAVQLEATWK